MKNRLHNLKFMVTFVLLCCISLSSQAADNKKKKVNKQITPAPVEQQLVLNGTFFVEKDGYGYNYYLIPEQNSSSESEFPYLSYSGPKLFLNFVNDKISFELRDLQRYKGIKGFDEYYEGIKDLDIYSLKAKEKEIQAALNDVHTEYSNEYKKYVIFHPH